MGAYTGFNKISGTNKPRPRKAFSKRKKLPTKSTLSIYESVLELQPSKNESEIYIGLGLLSVILITAFLSYTVPKFTDYHNTRSVQFQEQAVRSNKSTFNFLINSGKGRLVSNNLKGAYSEFKLAQAIYPKDDLVNQLLIETLACLCNNGNSYCNELDETLANSI